jgi:uncharacterized Zn-finger protein
MLIEFRQILANVYYCDVCDFTTKYPANLQAHRNSIHLQLKSFPCPQCSREFKDQSNRNRHVRSTHGQVLVRDFPCNLCSEDFKRSDNLTLHLKRVHGIARQTKNQLPNVMKCDLCIASYSTKIGLVKHMKNIHMNYQQREVFKCSVCAEQFFLRDSLKAHLESVHLMKFRCRFCDKNLGSAKTLRKHEEKCQK